jgi:hypothetical protein
VVNVPNFHHFLGRVFTVFIEMPREATTDFESPNCRSPT